MVEFMERFLLTKINALLSTFDFGVDKDFGVEKFNFSHLDQIRAFPSDPEINFLREKYGKYKFTHMAENWNSFQRNIINQKKFTFLNMDLETKVST